VIAIILVVPALASVFRMIRRVWIQQRYIFAYHLQTPEHVD